MKKIILILFLLLLVGCVGEKTPEDFENNHTDERLIGVALKIFDSLSENTDNVNFNDPNLHYLYVQEKDGVREIIKSDDICDVHYFISAKSKITFSYYIPKNTSGYLIIYEIIESNNKKIMKVSGTYQSLIASMQTKLEDKELSFEINVHVIAGTINAIIKEFNNQDQLINERSFTYEEICENKEIILDKMTDYYLIIEEINNEKSISGYYETSKHLFYFEHNNKIKPVEVFLKKE